MIKQLKYDKLYLQLAKQCSTMSHDSRRRVGCVIVLSNGLLSYGWNGMPAGMDNECKDKDGVTRIEVLHAEANALDKIARSTTSTVGATVYCTDSPCMPCALRLYGASIKRLVFNRVYNMDGVHFLRDRGILVDRL